MTGHQGVNFGGITQPHLLREAEKVLAVHSKEGSKMLRMEVPLWLAVVIIVAVVVVIVGIYWLHLLPRVREGAQPPPTAPIFKAGPGLGGKVVPEQPTKPEQPIK